MEEGAVCDFGFVDGGHELLIGLEFLGLDLLEIFEIPDQSQLAKSLDVFRLDI